MNRRNFIQAGLTLGAAASVGWAGEARRIKIGFLGGAHPHALDKFRTAKESADYELVGIAEEDPQVRKDFQKLGARFMSAAEVLSASEVVAVESGVKEHSRQGRMVLEAGKHLHLEKPPATNLAELDALLKLAAQKQRLLQMGYMWRYHPGFKAVREAVRQGWLGEVYLVRATINTFMPPERRPELAQFQGGILFELGPHMIDQIVRLLGRPEKVTPFLRTDGAADNLADNTAAVLEFKKCMAFVHTTTLHEGAGPHRSFEVLGTNGVMTIKPIEQPKLFVDLVKAAGPYAKGNSEIPMPRYQRYVPEFADLAEAIRQQRSLAVTAAEELLVQESLLRACGAA